MKEPVRFLSLFSGIEAASAAFLPLGWQCAGVAEIEPFPCAYLAHHYPDVPNLGDITQITEDRIRALGRIDVVVGGFPCQDLSIAGKRKGFENDDGTTSRSGLFFTALRIAEWSECRFTLLENVPGLFSSNEGSDFARVVSALTGSEFDLPQGSRWDNSGVAVGPSGLCEWCTLDARFFGLAQRRRRVFIIRDSGNWSRRAPLFLDAESLRGDPAPRRETRQDAAPTPYARTKGGGGLETDFDLDGGLIPELATTLTAGAVNGGAGHGAMSGSARENNLIIAPTLDANFDRKWGSNQWVDQGFAVLCASNGQANAEIAVNQAPTLTCDHEVPYITHALTGEGFDASEDGTGRGTPLVPIAFDSRQDPVHRSRKDVASYAPSSIGFSEGVGTLRAHGGDYGGGSETLIASTGNVKYLGNAEGGAQVRRLTPLECERLMGFPDRATLIPNRGKPAADGPRYKSLGNSMAVPCMVWIGKQIDKAMA